VKTWGLRILVIATLAVSAFWLRGRGPPPPAPGSIDSPPSSEAPDWSEASKTVTDFFQAAGEGDDEAYLDLLDGPLRRSLEETRSELGVEEFRRMLRRSVEAIKGLAVTPGEGAPGGGLALDVEIVFADRNEYQRMVLSGKGRAWRITSIDKARMVKPAVPYGTPVFEGLEARD